MNLSKESIKHYILIGLIVYILLLFYIVHLAACISYYPDQNAFSLLPIALTSMMTHPLEFEAAPKGLLTPCSIITIIYALGILYGVSVYRRDSHFRSNTEYGTAKWNDNLPEYNKKYTDPKGLSTSNGNRNMIFTEHVALSMDTRQTKRNNNVFVLGGSGAGKTRFFVKPNLCEMPLNCSFVCTDPSGELIKEVGTMLAGAGYKIKVFNLVEMKLSDTYNPLNYIHKESDVLTLTNCILENTTDPHKKGGEDFWEKAQQLMIQSFLFLLWKYGDALHLPKTLTELTALMAGCNVSENESSTEEETLTDKYFRAVESDGWYFIQNDGQEEFCVGKPAAGTEAIDVHNAIGSADIAVRQYHKFKLAANKTLKSILISAVARLSSFDVDDIINLTSTDTLQIDKLGIEKTALFIIIPQDHGTFNFLAAMLYSQLFQSLYYQAENEMQGNYLVKDSVGEITKVFPVEHIPDDHITNDTEEDEEEDVDLVADITEQKKKKTIIQTAGKKSTYTSKDAKEHLKLKVQYKFNCIKQKYVSKKQIEKLEKIEKECALEKEQIQTYEIHKRTIKLTKKKMPYEEAYRKANIDVEFENQGQDENATKEEIAIEFDQRPNDDCGAKYPEIEKKAKEYADNLKNAVCKKKGNTYIIKTAGANPEIIAEYTNPIFAKEKMDHLKEKCSVVQCGLYMPYHVRFLLDEFANIGQIPDFQKKLATMRKYELSCTIIVQALSQVKKIYDKDWETLIANCDTFLYLGSSEQDTLKYISDKLGKATIVVRNTSNSTGSKSGTSLSYQHAGRELLLPNEVGAIQDEGLVMIRGINPFKDKKYPFEKHKNYQYTADASKSNNYYIKRTKQADLSHLTFSTSTATTEKIKQMNGAEQDGQRYRDALNIRGLAQSSSYKDATYPLRPTEEYVVNTKEAAHKFFNVLLSDEHTSTDTQNTIMSKYDESMPIQADTSSSSVQRFG